MSLLSFDPAIGAAQPGPSTIVGGTEVASCQWPSVVALLEGDETPVMCSGTLIHPSVVLTAAHCIDPARPVVGLGFGEFGQGDVPPARVVAPTQCVGHPTYAETGALDVAYCMLSEPVTDVPIVPLLGECESEALTPGTEVIIVGFGSSAGFYDEDTGALTVEGVGPKRWIAQTVESVDRDQEVAVNMVGGNGSQSACFGDSGGPAMLRLGDGTWRVFGTGSHLYDPGGFDPPVVPGNVCGTGATYGFATLASGWLEEETGVDLTPCFDDDGNWDPSPECGDLPLQPDVGAGTWSNGCSGGPVGAATEPTCEPTGGTGSDESGSDDGSSSGDTSGETSESSDGTLPDDESSGGTSTGTPVDEPNATDPNPDPGDGTSTDDDGGAADGEAEGCGCRSAAPGHAALVLAGLFGLVRRRRRGSAPTSR